MVTNRSICRHNNEAPAVLSFQQKQLWFLNLLSLENPAYNCGYVMQLAGPLDIRAFTAAFASVLERHETLRTRFVSVEGEPMPQIAAEWASALVQIDLRALPAEGRRAEAQRLVKVYASRPFDLSLDLPLHAVLLRLEEDEAVFAYFPHHIVWELRSTNIFFTELSAYYEAFLQGRKPEIPLLPIQYSDYAVWQREYLSGETLESLKHYWREHLSGAPWRTNLPTDRPYPPIQNYQGARYPLTLPAPLRESVEAFSRENGSSAFRVLCAAFHLLLSCYTGQQQICLGTPVIPLLPREVETLIGLFAHTVVVRSQLTEGMTFRALTRQVSGAVTSAIRRALPFDLIVSAVQPPRDVSRMVLFQCNFRVVKAPLEPLTLPGMEITPPEWVDTDTSKFDLSMELVASGGPGGFIEYRTDLFDEASIARLADDYCALVVGIIAEPDRPVEEVHAVRSLRSRFRRFKPMTPRVNHRGRTVETDPLEDKKVAGS